jgi:hypothetical protein
MRNYQPKYRWKVSEQQIIILIYIHKFRFITTDILAEIVGKDRSTIYERLAVLEKQGYIAKQYDSTFRLRRCPATYCLAPLGIRTLKDNPRVEQVSLRQSYRNKSFTEEQIDGCLLVAQIYLHFRRYYDKYFDCYTKYQLSRDKFIRPTPVLFIRGRTDKIPNYVVDIIPAGLQTWIIRKRITQHEDFADDSDEYYPHVLFIAGNNNTEKRIVKLTEECYNDFSFYTTTMERLLHGSRKKLWWNPEEFLGLDDDEEPELIELPNQLEE